MSERINTEAQVALMDKSENFKLQDIGTLQSLLDKRLFEAPLSSGTQQQ